MTPEEKAARKRETHRRWRNGPGRAKYLAKKAKHRKMHRDKLAEKQRARYHRDPAAQSARSRAWAEANPTAVLVTYARRRAKEVGRECTITAADVVIPTHCPILGIELRRGDTDAAPSLDRIDNERGYVPGNVWVISKKANTLKGTGPLEELRRVVDATEEALDTMGLSS